MDFLHLTDQHFGFLRERGFEGPELRVERRERYPYVEYRKDLLEARVEFWFEWPELILIEWHEQGYPPAKLLRLQPDFSRFPALALAKRLLGRVWRLPLLFRRRELEQERREAVAQLGQRLRQDHEALMSELEAQAV